MKGYPYLFLCIAILATVLSYGRNDQESAKDSSRREATVEDQDVTSTVAASNRLALQLYQKLGASQQNFIFAPYSLMSSMGMVYSGADGLTESQMGRILYGQMKSEAVSKAIKSLNSSLATKTPVSSDDFFLNMSNSLWIQQGQPLLPAFQKKINDDYKSDVELIDFMSRPEAARVTINSWTAKHTQDKIRELIKPGTISNATRMLLVNAMYMRGKWQKTFDPNNTRQKPFFSNADETTTVPMMTLTSMLPYAKESNFALVELPYDSGKSTSSHFSMFVILPDETYGLDKIEQDLTLKSLTDLMGSLQEEKVILSMPRFKAKSELTLKDALEKIGLIEPFSNNADFSGIDGKLDLKISSVVQEAFVSVDEKGSEAGVATGVSVVAKSLAFPPPVVFNADHPFIFIIVDKGSKLILLIGKVVEPS